MKKPTRLALLLSAIFGVAYAAFGLSSPRVWNSPDETAVAFFARNFAHTGRLWSLDPYNAIANDLVHPRSIISVGAYLVPGSFYGNMWVTGVAYIFTGHYALSLVTAFATALAGYATYALVKRFMDERRALIACVLFLAHPTVWYFSSRGMFPNVLFFDLIILGIAAWACRPWRSLARGRGTARFETAIDDLLGAFAFSLAFTVRPVEFVWLAPLAIVVAWRSRKLLSRKRVLMPCVVFALFLSALLVTNRSLYGSALRFGYTAGSSEPGVSIPALNTGSRLPAFISAPRPFILPFGFHPKTAVINVWHYVIVFVPWLFVLALIGLFTYRDAVWRKRLGAALGWVTLATGLYYGSGVFTDSIGTALTVGSSYLRYFLPITILMVPFAAHGVDRLAAPARSYSIKLVTGITVGLLAAVVGLNAWTVLARNPESLIPMRNTLRGYEKIKQTVLSLTDPTDVIVVERSDKVFFPERHVIENLRDSTTLDAIPKLLHLGSVYYYGITIAADELPVLRQWLATRGLNFDKAVSFGNESLYTITSSK